MEKIKLNNMQKGFTENSSRIRVEEWSNTETGEIKQFAVISKEGQDKNWWKLWITDFMTIIGAIGNKKILVLTYILNNISPYDNTFSRTIREIATETKTSKTTVQIVLNILCSDLGFLVKKRVAQYMVNPEILAKGSHSKRVGLMIEYKQYIKEKT